MPGTIRDLIGRRFGRLVVASLENVRDHAYWRCVCDCGTQTVVRSNGLTSLRTISCGCLRADPAIRKAARLRTSARKRRAIAKLGGIAKAARTTKTRC